MVRAETGDWFGYFLAIVFAVFLVLLALVLIRGMKWTGKKAK